MEGHGEWTPYRALAGTALAALGVQTPGQLQLKLSVGQAPRHWES